MNHLYVREYLGCSFDNTAGNQNNIIHQYSLKFSNTSFGIVPNIIKTKKPTKPDSNLKIGDQNL